MRLPVLMTAVLGGNQALAFASAEVGLAYGGLCALESVNNVKPYQASGGGVYGTVPFTWAVGAFLTASISYEVP